MRRIPEAVRRQIADDPFMISCCYPGCNDAVQWHHPFQYQGQQIVDAWATVPACPRHHENNLFHPYFKLVALMRATEEDLKKYPRFDWDGLKKFLFWKYFGIGEPGDRANDYLSRR